MQLLTCSRQSNASLHQLPADQSRLPHISCPCLRCGVGIFSIRSDRSCHIVRGTFDTVTAGATDSTAAGSTTADSTTNMAAVMAGQADAAEAQIEPSVQGAMDVAVQTDLHLLQHADAGCRETAASTAELAAPSRLVLGNTQQLRVLPASEAHPQQASGRQGTRDTSCGPEANDASCLESMAAAEAKHSSPSSRHKRTESVHSSSGHCLHAHSSSVRANRPSTADSHNSDQSCRSLEATFPSQEESACSKGQQKDSAEGQSRQCTAGEVPQKKAKADAKWSRGLQLPQKLSIASLAKHAGVDRAFMQVSKLLICCSRQICTSMAGWKSSFRCLPAYVKHEKQCNVIRPSSNAYASDRAARHRSARQSWCSILSVHKEKLKTIA